MSTIVSEDYTVITVLHEACEICEQLIFSAIGESRLVGNPFLAKQLHGRDSRGYFSVVHEAVVIKTALHENYMKVELPKLKKGLLRGIQNCV